MAARLFEEWWEENYSDIVDDKRMYNFARRGWEAATREPREAEKPSMPDDGKLYTIKHKFMDEWVSVFDFDKREILWAGAEELALKLSHSDCVLLDTIIDVDLEIEVSEVKQ